MDLLEQELVGEKEATIEWNQNLCLKNSVPKAESVFAVDELSQYECDLCEEKHYHTKRNVKTR